MNHSNGTKLLPANADAERGILSAFFLSPMQVGAICAERGVLIEHFHVSGHGKIYGKLIELWSDGKGIDAITVSDALAKDGALERCGGFPGIATISTTLPTAALILDHIEITIEAWRQRQGFKICGQYGIRFQEEDGESRKVVAELADDIAKLAQVKTEREYRIKPLVGEAVTRAGEAVERRGQDDPDVVFTGFSEIDASTGGFRPTDFVLISGQEKVGKSMFAQNVVQFNCLKGSRCAIVSLEMPSSQITDRLICAEGQISLSRLLNGWMTQIEVERFSIVAPRVAGWNLTIHDTTFALIEICATFRQLKAQFPDFKIGVVDYLQLVVAQTNKNANREQEVASISRTLRLLAKDLGIIIIALVQLNDDGKTRESRQPAMDCTHHIRLESTPLEKNATDEEKNNVENLKIARIVTQRNGPSNVVIPLVRRGEYLRFESAKLNN